MLKTLRALRVLPACMIAGLATSAPASDYYVDVVHGNNSNAGTTPATAWKTLTFALAATFSGTTDTIHVAPGTYSTASGESFPLYVTDQDIIGDSGSEATIVLGDDYRIFRIQTHPLPAGARVSIRGFTLRNGGTPVGITWVSGHLDARLSDLVIEGPAIQGLALGAGFMASPTATVDVRLENVRTVECSTGLAISGVPGGSRYEVVDCSFENGTRGIWVGGGTSIRADFERCRITGNTGDGVTVNPASANVASAMLSECLIANNGRHGVIASTFGTTGTASVALRRCTVARNANIGIGSVGIGLNVPGFHLEEVLCSENSVDYSNPTGPTGSFSQIGGPNPMFRDPLNGDFRVNFGSPVIDAGDPATPIDTLDLALVPRSIDGNLDTLERADIGCHEFRTLDIDTTGQQGTLLELEIFGAAGHSSSMRLGRGAFGAPVATPFGEFDMNAIANLPWVTFPVAPGPGFLFQRTIPAAPIFIGQVYSFQGLVTSSTSPSGSAWSNAVSFTIRP